ncbi:MAG: class I SAM-dependent methyltransferase [Chloroflexota bacterium]
MIERIRRAIEQAGGRLSFRDYMDLALYDPTGGYYVSAAEKTGRRGDYLTSPLISPLFGQTIGRFVRMAVSAGLPSRVVELGAGDGSLAEALLAGTDCIEYTIIERSEDFRDRQRERLGDRVAWLDAVPEGFQGLVLSNELIDALAVHRLVGDRERYVAWDGGLVEELGPYSTGRLEAYFNRLGLRPAGQAEVNLDALDVMDAVYRRLGKAMVVTVDYGSDAEDLFLCRPQGTFLTYYRHGAGENPYERVGQQDMTSHVDFTSLRLLGEEHGFRTTTYATQAEFLISHGIGDLLVEAQARMNDAAAYVRARQAVATLLNPAGMGGFKVLVQERA